MDLNPLPGKYVDPSGKLKPFFWFGLGCSTLSVIGLAVGVIFYSSKQPPAATASEPIPTATPTIAAATSQDKTCTHLVGSIADKVQTEQDIQSDYARGAIPAVRMRNKLAETSGAIETYRNDFLEKCADWAPSNQ